MRCRAPALSASGPGALCVVARGSLALCVGARCSLCRGPALSRRSPCALSGPSARPALNARQSGARRPRPGSGVGPALAALSVSCCRSPRLSLSVSGPLSLCRGPAVYVSGPGDLRVGARRLALCVRAPAPCAPLGLSVSVFRWGPACSLSGAWCSQLRSAGPKPRSACHPSSSRASSSDPRATHPFPIRIQSAGPQLRSACRPSSPRAPNSDARATHPARRISFFQESEPYCLGENEQKRNQEIISYVKRLSHGSGFTANQGKFRFLKHTPS